MKQNKQVEAICKVHLQYFAGHLSSYKCQIANSKLLLLTANPINEISSTIIGLAVSKK